MDYLICITPRLLESLTLAAIEAYCLGDGNESTAVNKVQARETLGYIWGFKRMTTTRTIYSLDRMSLSLSARREVDTVVPNPKALRLKNEVVSMLSPEVTLLADFHSHPFPGLKEKEVTSEKLYYFSPQDNAAFVNDDYLWSQSSNNPIMLVTTVCERTNGKTDVLDYPQWNVATYSLGQFKFWLNAVVGYIGANGKRTHTRNSTSSVWLRVDNYIQNLEQARIKFD